MIHVQSQIISRKIKILLINRDFLDTSPVVNGESVGLLTQFGVRKIK